MQQMDTVRLIGFSRPLSLVAAQYKGFFEAEGLRVEYTQTPNSTYQIRSLLAGDFDLASTAADNVMAYVEREGADLFVFMVADLGLGQKLFVQPDISSYSGLRGKVLGVDALDTGYAFVLRKMLQLNGLGEEDYALESVGGTPQRLAALRSGRVAGALLGPPVDDEALREGFRMLQPASDYFPVYPGSTSATTRRWAEAHPDLLVRYIRGYLAGAAWSADPRNREEGIRLLAADQGVSPDVAAVRYDMEKNSRSVDLPGLDLVRSALEVVLGLRWEMTRMAGPKPDVSKYFDPTYWQRATGAAG